MKRNEENCREMHRNSEKCKEIQRNAEKFSEMQRHVEKCRELQKVMSCFRNKSSRKNNPMNKGRMISFCKSRQNADIPFDFFNDDPNRVYCIKRLGNILLRHLLRVLSSSRPYQALTRKLNKQNYKDDKTFTFIWTISPQLISAENWYFGKPANPQLTSD